MKSNVFVIIYGALLSGCSGYTPCTYDGDLAQGIIFYTTYADDEEQLPFVISGGCAYLDGNIRVFRRDLPDEDIVVIASSEPLMSLQSTAEGSVSTEAEPGSYLACHILENNEDISALCVPFKVEPDDVTILAHITGATPYIAAYKRNAQPEVRTETITFTSWLDECIRHADLADACEGKERLSEDSNFSACVEQGVPPCLQGAGSAELVEYYTCAFESGTCVGSEWNAAACATPGCPGGGE